MRSRLATALLTSGAYAALVVWLTWPLAGHLATHLPGTGGAARFDTLLIAWTLSWQSHALVTDPCLLPHGNAFHPAPLSVFYGEAGLGALPYFLPTFLLTGNPALALNLVFLAGAALTASGVHLLVRHWTGSGLAALVAGFSLLANRWLLWSDSGVPSAPNYALLHYLPAIVLLAAELPDRPRAVRWLVPLVVLQCLTSVYVAAGVLGTLLLLALARLVRPATRAAGRRLLAAVALAVPAVLLLFAGYLRVRMVEPSIATQSHWNFGFFPAVLPWNFLTPVAPTAIAFPALLLVAAGAVLALREWARGDGPAVGPWLTAGAWVIAGLLIATPPVAVWQGRFVALPHAPLAAWVPVYGVLRIPSRMAVGALVGLALLVGLAFAACERSLSRGTRRSWVTLGGRLALCGAACALIHAAYAHGFAVPPGLRAYLRDLPPSYPLRAAISGDTPIVRLLQQGTGPLLELPVPVTPGGRLVHEPQAEAMYRSIFHWRPLLNGYSGYWPRGFPERMALARRLPDAAALDDLRRETGLTQILVHLDALPANGRAPWLALAARPDDGLRLAGRDGNDLLFDVVSSDAIATGPPLVQHPRGRDGCRREVQS